MQKIWKDCSAITIRDHPHWSGHQKYFDPASMCNRRRFRYAIIGKGTLEPAFMGHQYGF